MIDAVGLCVGAATLLLVVCGGGEGAEVASSCPSARLKASGACAVGEDYCPFQLTLPPLSLQLPRSFRTLEKSQRELQSLKQEVTLLKSLQEEVANLTDVKGEVEQLRSVKEEEVADLRALKEELTRLKEEVGDLQGLREEVAQLRSLREEVQRLQQCCGSGTGGWQWSNVEVEKEEGEVEVEEKEEAQQDQPGRGDDDPPPKGLVTPKPGQSKRPSQSTGPGQRLREVERELTGVTRGLRNATAKIAILEERLSQLQPNGNGNNTGKPCSTYCPAHAPAPMTMTAPRDCSDYSVMGRRTDGVYRVTPDPRVGTVSVWCDMASLGGGWTVIQRRLNGSLSFNRSWADYKQGFGELNGDLWLGNELIHWLTRGRDMVLRVELQDDDGRREHAKYEHFYVANEQLRYKLTVSGYSGTAGDAFLHGDKNFRHDQMFFSTPDRDNDMYEKGSCAAYYSSGWWFNACMSANLNGRHYRKRYRGMRNGIFWGTWPNATHEYYPTGYRQAFRSAKMMIRPRNYSP